MSDDALKFRELIVRRMPGFPSGGIGLREVSPGINLVRGLNASGKTTTARALQTLLWRTEDREHAALEGRFELSGESWLVDVDGARVQWQRNGRPASPPPLPPAESRSRYYLSLHELLREDDGELAELIRVESDGGYDVPGAARRLRFGAGGAKRSLVNALRDAREVRRKVTDQAMALRRQKRELEDQRRALEALEGRARSRRVLERALDLARAREAVEEARRAVASFPEPMASLRGDEVDRLEEWSTAADKQREALSAARHAAGKAEAALEEAGLGEDAPDAAVLRELEERVSEVKDAERAVVDARTALATARTERRQAEESLGITGAKEEPSGHSPDVPLDLALADRLDDFLRRAENLRSNRAGLDEIIAALGDDADGAETEAPEEEFQSALRVLREWLRTGAAGEDRRLRDWLLVGASLLLVLSGVAVVVFELVAAEGPSPSLLTTGSIAAVAGLGILTTLLVRPAPVDHDARSSLEKEAARLGHAPVSWTADAVRKAVDTLERAVAAKRIAEARHAERARLETRREALDEAEAKLEEERGRIATDLGVTPPPGDLSLHAVGTRILALDRAAREEARARGRLEEAREHLQEELGLARTIVEPFGYQVEDCDGLVGARSALKARCDTHREATLSLASARQREEEANEGLREIDDRREALFEALGIDDEPELRKLVDHLEAFRVASSDLEGALRVRDTSRGALREMADAGHPTAAELLKDPDDGFHDPEELERRLGAAEDAVERANEVRESIAKTEQALDEARHQRELEEAIAREEDAKAELEAQRARDVEDAIGAVLADWLRSRSTEENRPAVFRRARELFVEITRGRFRLMMGDGDTADFRALDTRTKRGRSLDELSTGTRLQLLLSVRMAFVETLEAGCSPPILLDEVLANSDAPRATAIIDATLALARAGRQVFYFTAQADEVAKWRDALEGTTVPWAELDLVPGSADGPAFEWGEGAVGDTVVPRPEGSDHTTYGLRLGIPPVDLWAPDAGGLHLWYLVEDVQTLHELLGLGLSTWGELEALAAGAGEGASPVVRSTAEDVAGLAGLCRRFLDLRRQGRGRPVDRSVLKASGAVSERWMDEVTDLCEELGGRGDALVTALLEKRLSGFWTSKAEELRTYLSDEGYITEEEPLPEEEIVLELQAHSLRHGTGLDRAEISKLITRLSKGPV